ncbi:hypothetical protein DL768_006721 [Monosporascus sp. mg162]|nr:hypothetical protein DL768_006721 [Monosporascus sp. mg162]
MMCHNENIQMFWLLPVTAEALAVTSRITNSETIHYSGARLTAMEGLGIAANVIAVVDLSAKVATLCFQYSTAVAGARADVTRLQNQVNQLGVALRRAKQLVEGPNSRPLAASRELADTLQECIDELRRVQDKLEPGPARKAMRRFGLRALKWPFSSKDIESVVTNLKRCEQTILLGLQIDQTSLLLSITNKVEGIPLQAAEDLSIARKPHFTVPFPADPDFVHRPAIWTWITQQYAGPTSRMALVGSKSQIAIHFAHHVHAASPEVSVFWVHGSTKARFEESYRSLADALALPRRRDPGVNIFALVRDWLQKEDVRPWLMIIDNADDVDMFFPRDEREDDTQVPVASYLPKTGNGKILVTSRSLSAAEKLTGSHKAIIGIPTMDSSEALQLFRNKLNGCVDEDAAADLVCALDFIPLAVNHAAAYINRRAPRVSIRSYLDDFRKNHERRGSLLNSDVEDLRRHESVSNSVVMTWQVTFEQVRRERPAAANLLVLMSLFHAQNIPEYLLHGYSDVALDRGESGEDDNRDFEDDLNVLRDYSLISITAAQGFFLNEEPSEENDKLGWSELLTNMSWYMLMMGEYSKAERLAQNAVKVRKAVSGEDHPDTLTSMGSLAAAYGNQGRWKEAEELEVRVMETRKRLLGDDQPDTLISMGNLASIYGDQGRWKEAEELEVRVMETRKRVLGEDHPDTLISMGNLVSTYKHQGRWKEAKELEVRVMETRKRLLGEHHPDTLRSMESLALTKGYWAGTIPIRWQQIIGPDHPDTRKSVSALESWQANLGGSA